MAREGGERGTKAERTDCNRGAVKRRGLLHDTSSCFAFIGLGRITLGMHDPRWSGQILHFDWLVLGMHDPRWSGQILHFDWLLPSDGRDWARACGPADHSRERT